MTAGSNLRQDVRHGTSGGPARLPLTDTPIIDSASLFADKKQVQIRHGGQIYRLRVTRNGKLILNK